MPNICWGAPILPGKYEQWKAFNDEMQGPRWAEHVASRQEMGIQREVVSLMHTPDGEFVCLYHEADDIPKTFEILATSSNPYLEWFRQQVAEIHGISPEMLRTPPPVDMILDYRA